MDPAIATDRREIEFLFDVFVARELALLPCNNEDTLAVSEANDFYITLGYPIAVIERDEFR